MTTNLDEVQRLRAEVERLTAENTTMAAALDEEERKSGISTSGNMWRFWSDEARKRNEIAKGLRAQLAAIQPAPDTMAEPVAWTGSGSLMALKDGREGFMFPAAADAHPIPLYTHPPADTMAQVREDSLVNLLCLADEALMNLNGCFPFSTNTEEQRSLRDACVAIRKVTGEDYHERKRRAALALLTKEG